MTSISLKIEGLDQLAIALDESKLQDKLITGIGILTEELHNVLNAQVQGYYKTNRSLNSVRLNKTSSNLKRGKGFIRSGLEYKFQSINLASFPEYAHFLGNINTNATKEGLVQQVTITRKNRYTVIRGKKNYGGFVPSNGRGIRVGRFMLERQQKATWLSSGVRAPTKPLFAPSLSQMAATQFNLPFGNVHKFKDKLPNLLIKYLDI
jgi:hypothetical protein